MTRFWNAAPALLLATGLLLGLTLPFGKFAAAAGIGASVWSFVLSFGSAVLLLGAMTLRGDRLRFGSHWLRYYGIAAFLSYAAPNLAIYSAIPHLGAGYTGLLFTLSPVFTLLLSILFRVRRPTGLGMLGIAIGFLGAIVIAWTRGEIGRPAEPIWIAIALIAPLGLAAGNVYRSVDWPKGAGAIQLATGSHFAAAAMLLAYMAASGEIATVGRLADLPGITAALVISSALMFPILFRLQEVGGPVYLSQIGYIAAAFGLVSGVLVLGERYALATWLGAAIVMAGIALTTLAQARPSGG